MALMSNERDLTESSKAECNTFIRSEFPPTKESLPTHSTVRLNFFNLVHPSRDQTSNSHEDLLCIDHPLGLRPRTTHRHRRWKEAAVGKHLYVASLRLTAGGETECGGSLIAPNVILTAAHCTVELNGAIKYAVIGSHYNGGTQYGETIKVTKQIVHPKNNPDTNSYDFAIYILDSNSKQTPVKVSFDTVAGSVPTVVRGWGATSEGGNEPSVLEELTINTLTNTKCAQLLSGYNVDSTMICAGGQVGKDSCQGDSGGPLTIQSNGQESLVGVVSWGLGCAEANKPGVYGRISAVKDFIQPYLTSRAAAFQVDAVDVNNSTDIVV
ncbi:hypothetical protein AC1031_004173 [Aphanomyces cochlioides]|nr:hypothetical protein AC1031_004173 [Aphanomyces cochlioides]